MKLTCQQHALSRGLSVVGHAISARSTLPILSHIRLVAEAGQLHLSASNGEMSIHARIDAEVEIPGVTTVPARLISEYVASLPASPVHMTVPEGTFTCQMRCARSQATLRGMEPELFPQIPGAREGCSPIILDAVMLKEGIDQVIIAAAEDKSRPAFAGVHMEVDHAGQLVFAAADSIRLAVRKIPVSEEHRQGVLIPVKALEHLSRILPVEGAVEILMTPNAHQIIFHTEQTDLIAQLLEATFPNFSQVIPQQYVTRAITKTHEMVAAIKEVAPFARDAHNVVRVMINGPDCREREPNTLMLEATAADIGSNVTAISATVLGPDQEILLSVKHLASVLAVMDMPEIALEMTGPTRAAQIKPALGPTVYHYVMMPITPNQTRDIPRASAANPTNEPAVAIR